MWKIKQESVEVVIHHKIKNNETILIFLSCYFHKLLSSLVCSWGPLIIFSLTFSRKLPEGI